MEFVNEFISETTKFLVMTKMYHFEALKKSSHVTVGVLYDSLQPIYDKCAEALQGIHEDTNIKELSIKLAVAQNDAEFIKQIKIYRNFLEVFVGQYQRSYNHSEIASKIDEIKLLLGQIIYLLKKK